jgi:hypothetical protein
MDAAELSVQARGKAQDGLCVYIHQPVSSWELGRRSLRYTTGPLGNVAQHVYSARQVGR